ncbi:MAG: type II secretion system F family protein [Nitrospirota bacterium]
MPRFTYKASNQEGKILQGILEGDKSEQIVEKLRKQNLIPIEVKEEILKKGISGFFRQVKSKDTLAFTQQLSNLLDAGMPLNKSLDVLEKLTKNQKFKTAIYEIRAEIERGSTFSNALANHPKVFSPLYINMVKVGELSGALELILDRLADFSGRDEDFKEYIRSMMVYPCILVFFGLMAITIILTVVIPKFMVIFEDMGQSLPLITLVFITISKFIVGWWWVILGVGIIFIIGMRGYIKTEKGRYCFDKFKLKIPVLGSLVEMIVINRFSKSLSTLLKGGVALLPSLLIVKEAVGNAVISKSIGEIQGSIKEGEKIATPLRASGVFPDLLVYMVACGEETGNLEDMLNKVADTYEIKIKNSLRALIALVEPCIILCMGIFVAFIFISILLPIFAMSELPF